MFAGQKPDPSWRQALPPPDDPGPGARGTEPVAAKATVTSSRAGGFQAPMFVFVAVLGLAALASVGFVGILILRPDTAPKTAAPLPALASAVPPLVAVASNPLSDTIEPERLSIPEPPPIQYGVSQQASLEAAPLLRRQSFAAAVPRARGDRAGYPRASAASPSARAFATSSGVHRTRTAADGLRPTDRDLRHHGAYGLYARRNAS